jgi:phosphatidylglycerol:prolipoprotein diacylglycerol transferase
VYPILIDWTIPGLGFHLRMPSFGFFLAAAFVSAIQLGHYRALKKGYDPEVMGNFYVVLILSSMLGARATYVGLEWDRFSTRPWEMFLIWRGGLVFYGGVLGGFLGCYAFVRTHGMSPLALADLAAPCLALGHAVGRIGCFLNGCCHGVPTDLPWGVAFPFTTGGSMVPRHPTQIYEAVGVGLICLWLSRHFYRAHRPGSVAVLYGILYAPLRFAVEMLRGDDRGGSWLGLSPSQLGSIACLALAVAAWAVFVRGRPLVGLDDKPV